MSEREALFSFLRRGWWRYLGLASVRRCNDPDPNGDGMRLCDLWPSHRGPHVNVSADDGVTELKNRG